MSAEAACSIPAAARCFLTVTLAPPQPSSTDLCYTTPEGQGALAQAGQLSVEDNGRWDEKDSKLGPALHVEQRCGDDAVVVSYAVGKGEAIWWSSSMPLTNGGLHEDASLRLLLATVGGPGARCCSTSSTTASPPGLWDAAKGLPLWWLFGQFVLIALLLVLSFSRRNGPIADACDCTAHVAGGVRRIDGPPVPTRRSDQRRHGHGAAETAALSADRSAASPA